MATDIKTLGFVDSQTFQTVVEDGFNQTDDGDGFEYIVGEFKGGEIKIVYEPAGDHCSNVFDGVNGMNYVLCFEDEKLAEGK